MDGSIDHAEVGLFLVKYRVLTSVAGAPALSLALMVNAPNRVVSGFAKVSQAVQHPDLVSAQITGSYQEISDANGTNYSVSMDGYAPVAVNQDTSPVLHAELTLVGGWDSGTANFSFRRAPYGPMTHISGAKIEPLRQT